MELVPTIYDNRALPIPSPALYSDIYYPPNPTLRPLLQRDRIRYNDHDSFPIPLGELSVYDYNLLGLPIHHDMHVRNTPDKLFTRWHEWYLEIDEHLIRHICPADLNDLPCIWDELQGGCDMLRLCVSKRKYPHPHLGLHPECRGELRNICSFIHDIEPTCWSLHEQLVLAPDRQFQSYQTCPIVAEQTDDALSNVSSFCKYGHDMEGARIEAWWAYWEHTAQAMRHGAVGVTKEDRYGVPVRNALKPKRQTLSNTSPARNLDGSLSGRTWHGHWVNMTCMVGSDRPLAGPNLESMVADWDRCELRPSWHVATTAVEDQVYGEELDKSSSLEVRRCRSV